MLYSFGWFFAGGIVVFSGGAAFCFFLLTFKKSNQSKEKSKVPHVGGYNKHDSKKPQKGWRGEGQKRQGECR
jgi:hypothetical protein